MCTSHLQGVGSVSHLYACNFDTPLFIQCQRDNEARMAKLKIKKEEKTKRGRIEHKKQRAALQSKR